MALLCYHSSRFHIAPHMKLHSDACMYIPCHLLPLKCCILTYFLAWKDSVENLQELDLGDFGATCEVAETFGNLCAGRPFFHVGQHSSNLRESREICGDEIHTGSSHTSLPVHLQSFGHLSSHFGAKPCHQLIFSDLITDSSFYHTSLLNSSNTFSLFVILYRYHLFRCFLASSCPAPCASRLPPRPRRPALASQTRWVHRCWHRWWECRRPCIRWRPSQRALYTMGTWWLENLQIWKRSKNKMNDIQ